MISARAGTDEHPRSRGSSIHVWQVSKSTVWVPYLSSVRSDRAAKLRWEIRPCDVAAELGSKRGR
jgi:hypothetical protein